MPEKDLQEYSDDLLLLDHQLCFPLYACAREIIKLYRPFLDKIGLTYTQYITMMVLWEEQSISSRELGKRLFLDSGTLTPVLKKLENSSYVNRSRDERDERNLIVTITEAGQALRSSAERIPGKMASCIPLNSQDAGQLYTLLYKLLDTLKDSAQ